MKNKYPYKLVYVSQRFEGVNKIHKRNFAKI